MMYDIFKADPWLKPYSPQIERRHEATTEKEVELLKHSQAKTLYDFATGHLYFGLHRTSDGWVYRDWLPMANEVCLIGDFNDWQVTPEFQLRRKEHGVWEIELPKETIAHGMCYKLHIKWNGGSGKRVPAWANYVIQHPETHLFAAKVWAPDTPYTFRHKRVTHTNEPLLIYESHIGMATEEEGIGTYNEFREKVLPKIAEKGYNAVQIMAIMEHPYYGSFGYQVSSFFAPSSRFGTPDDLKALVDEARRLGLVVIMDLVHSHSVRNEEEGLARYDGTLTQFFHEGGRGWHPQWESMCFDYDKNEVLHFLLSNCKYWLEEYGFDGFRFDGVTSMIYLNHGLEQSFCSYNDYFNEQQDEGAITYLMLANKVIHETYEHAITIAEEVSGMPGLATGFDDGGYGFDYRMAMNIPDFWIKLIKETPLEYWNPGSIWWECTNRRKEEKTISYTESHDQALVGDKTILFRLVDQDMYWHMQKDDPNEVVSRGMALHKMIRLVTLTTINGGYLTFMGNEFGHPEWIDFPREGNNWSHHYARRQWSLEEDQNLKYHFLSDFERAMLKHVKEVHNFGEQPLYQLWEKMEDQVLAYERGRYVYVFNFNPYVSHVDYKFMAPAGEYEVVLDTDDLLYGGDGRNDKSVHHFTLHDPEFTRDGKGWLSLYLPSRSAIVLRKL